MTFCGIRAIAMHTMLLAAVLGVGFDALAVASETPPPADGDRPTVVVVVGAPGAEEYAEPFSQWADRWEQGAARGGAELVRIGDDPAGETTDRERLKTLLDGATKASAHPLWLVLIGHGTFDGKAAKFNLRGPDITGGELAGWLESFERPLVVINCASSSAPFVNRLSGANRVVITATKSGYELNYARFGDYMSAAILDPATDLDKDEETSLLEAFLTASARVAEFYQQEARLATETAIIDDNGDGLGTQAAWFRGVRVVRQARQGASTDGARAHQIHLIPSQREQAIPADVRAQRDALELAVARLRDSKVEGVDEDAYYAQLEPILVELARLYASLEESEGTANDATGPSR